MMRRPLAIICAILLSSAFTCAAVDYSRTIEELSQYITNQLDVSGASSIALVLMDGDRVILADGFGLADPVEGIPADADTIYCIGSISKTFAVFSAMRWWDRGLLDLDAPVTNIVPEFAFHDERFPGSPPITPRLLMNHQSGLPGHYCPYAISTEPYPFYGKLMLADMADEYPVCPPNFVDAYNNNGFTLLGIVLAELSGRTFVEEATDDVFHELGMTNTFYLTNAAQLDLPARSMLGTNAYPTEVLNVYAAGGAYSSANDMRRAVEMLLADGEFQGDQFLSSNALSTMLTYQGTNISLSSSDPFFKSGLGFDSVAGADLAYAGRSYYKGGDTLTYHSWLEIMPDHGLGVAVMANGGRPSMGVAQRALMLALRDKFGTPLPTNGVAMPDSPLVEKPPFPWDQIEGYYARFGSVALVTASEGYLALKLNAYDPGSVVYTNLAPHENGWFWEPGNPDFQLSFTNAIDRLFASVRMNSGRYWSTILLGERIEPVKISDQWLDRMQKKWIPADLDPFSFLWLMSEVFVSGFNDQSGATLRANPLPRSMPMALKSEFRAQDGFLFFSNQAFGPVSDTLAFPFITGRHDLGSLNVVEVYGEEWLRLSGDHYRPLDNIPVLHAPGSTNAVLSGDIIGWYRVPKTGGGRLELNITGSPLPQVRVMNDDFVPLNAMQPVPGRYLVASTGDIYVAVTKGLEGGESYTLRALWRAVESDYSGDLTSNPAVYYEPAGLWYILGTDGESILWEAQWGGPGMTPVPGDFTGDGISDLAVYDDTTGSWFIRSLDGDFVAWNIGWGFAGALPVPGDFTGDGISDLAVYHEETGTWYILSMDGSLVLWSAIWGGPGFLPVPGDFTGDGTCDLAVYHEETGIWFVAGTDRTVASGHIWGGPGFRPVPGDFTGDGISDLAVYHEETGTWFITTMDGSVELWNAAWGGPGFRPVPGDYTGNGISDLAVYADGYWYILTVDGELVLWEGHWGGADFTPVGR